MTDLRVGPNISPGPGVRAIEAEGVKLTGTVVLSGGANITVGTDAGNLVTISGGAGGGGNFSAGVSNIGNTSGDTGTVSNRVVLAGGNNITVSQSTNAGGATITISGGAGAGGFAGGGISGGNTSGDTGSVTGRLIFAGNNNITLSGSTNAGSMTISISAAAQTGTQFSGGLSNIGNTAGDTGTVAGRLVLAGGNRITLSGSTNGVSETVTISAPNAQTGISGIANSETTYTSGTVSLSELGAVTVRSTTGNQYQISVNSQTVQTQNMVAISATNTLYTSGTVTLTGSNMVTVKSSAAGQGVIIDATQTAQTQSNIQGIANSETTYQTGTVELVDLANITIRSTTGQKYEFSVAAPGGGAAPDLLMYQYPEGNISTVGAAIPNATMYFMPIELGGNLTVHRFGIPISASGASGSSASAFLWAGVYTKNAGTLSLASSGSMAQSWTSNSVASNDWGGVFGPRRWDITGLTWNMTPGQYWVGLNFRSSNAGSFSYLIAAGTLGAWSGHFRALSSVTSNFLWPGGGVYTASTTGVPGSVGYSNEINNQYSGGNIRLPSFVMLNSSLV